jgi:hypothetical protein
MKELDNFSVVAISGVGVYVTDGTNAWRVAADSKLAERSDALADAYGDVTE